MAEPEFQQIGDYEVIRELGHGGMGRVYKVRNLLSDRVEAMKVLLPDLAGKSDFVSRFMREIKLLASLDHPNIAALRTAFTADNQFVMIMEYVDGITLAQRLDQGPIPVGDAINYTDQVLTALSYAHSKHVIHRDIKPANMMLTSQGVVKLMDFGIARSGNDFGLTMTGATLGSLDYMSPEQVQSQRTDERSDLYSVGVSLYQMVTGQRMFSETSGYSLMQAHVKEVPRPPIEIQPTLPKALNDLIMMAVAKDPAQRFQTADAFRRALSAVQTTAQPPAAAAAVAAVGSSQAVAAAVPAPDRNPTPTPVPPSASGNRNRSLLIGVAALLILAALAAAGLYRSHQQSAAAKVAVASEQPASVPGPSANAIASAPNSDVPPTPPPQPPKPTTHQGGGRGASSAIPGVPNDASAADAQPPGPSPAEQKKLLDDLEREEDQLDGRVAAAESSLDALEQQMHNSGLGLRGDMVAARTNLRTDMGKAKQALDSGDTERSRHYLDLAHHELERIETFLGRR